MIVGIDPGVSLSATAEMSGGQLLSCGFTKPKATSAMGGNVIVVCEIPQAYERSEGKDRQDIVDLAMVAGEWRQIARAGGVAYHRVFPREWKGQQKKWTNHYQTWFSSMTEADRRVFATCTKMTEAKIAAYIEAACNAHALGKTPKYSWKAHNLLDAVGIAIYGEKTYGK